MSGASAYPSPSRVFATFCPRCRLKRILAPRVPLLKAFEALVKCFGNNWESHRDTKSRKSRGGKPTWKKGTPRQTPSRPTSSETKTNAQTEAPRHQKNNLPSRTRGAKYAQVLNVNLHSSGKEASELRSSLDMAFNSARLDPLGEHSISKGPGRHGILLSKISGGWVGVRFFVSLLFSDSPCCPVPPLCDHLPCEYMAPGRAWENPSDARKARHCPHRALEFAPGVLMGTFFTAFLFCF
jgi:hypothetical protein